MSASPRCEEDGNHVGTQLEKEGATSGSIYSGTQLEKEGATSGYIYSGQQVAGWGWGGGLLSGRYPPRPRASPPRAF